MTVDDDIPLLAKRLARQCRRVIQCCLREEEWRDADEEFTRIIASGLKQFRKTFIHGPSQSDH